MHLGFVFWFRDSFDPRVADKNQSSELKVEICNLRVVMLLKLLDTLSPELVDGLPHVSDVLWTLGKLGGVQSDRLFGGDTKILWRGEVGCFKDVEWE